MGLEIAGRALEPPEWALLREAAEHGWVECKDELVTLLVALGQDYELCSSQLQRLARDALVALARAGGDQRVQDGLRTQCEVPTCGQLFDVRRLRGVTRGIEWLDGPVIYSEDDPPGARFLLNQLLETNQLLEQVNLPPARVARYGVARWERLEGSLRRTASGTVRYILLCPDCRRRKLRRCAHESFRRGAWRQCCEIAVGSIYCKEHRSQRYRSERRRGCRHRKSATPQPSEG